MSKLMRVIVVLFIILLACGKNSEIIPVFTVTSSPSPTSIPTATPSPSPTVVEEVDLEGPTVTFFLKPSGVVHNIEVDPEVYRIIGRRLIMEVKNRQVTYISVLTIVDPNKKFYTLSSKESFLITGELITPILVTRTMIVVGPLTARFSVMVDRKNWEVSNEIFD